MSLQSRALAAMKEWQKTNQGALFAIEEQQKPIEKRNATMAQEHLDPQVFFEGQTLAFEGSKEDDTLSLTVAVCPDPFIRFKPIRGTSKKRRLSGSQRRKLKRMHCR